MQHIHHLFHSIQQLSRQLIFHKNKALEPFGLYSAQWAIIYTLKTKGPTSQKVIGEYLRVEAPHITRTVKKLIEQGYCRIVPGEDKRVKLVQLTEEAVREYPKWEQAVLDVNESLANKIPQTSQQELHELVHQWLSQLSEEDL